MKHRQRGATLIVAVGLLGLLAIAALARALASPPDIENRLATEKALTRARDALAAYGALGNAAGNHNNSPGALPCPDLDNDGVSDLACSAHIGRLPWKTLGIGRLLDGAGECLWYARSATFSNNIPTSERGSSADQPALNPATPGGIEDIASGGPTGQRVAAVIIAPGVALPGQARSGANGISGCRDGDIGQFVDGVTIDGTAYHHGSGLYVITIDAQADFNDTALALGTSRLFFTAGARVLGESTLSPDGTPPFEWWTNNAWCDRVCTSGTSGVVPLADGSRVTRVLPTVPACSTPCSGS